jgi:phenylacetic acid degradation operon negative regulatory protein
MNERITPRTVIEAFLPPSGSVDLSTIYNEANAVGIGDQPLRLAIRRLIANGEVEQHGRGRAGTLRLTSLGQARQTRDGIGLALAFGQDDGSIRWDGKWHLVAISAPENQRAVRDSLRRALHAAGAATISTGLVASAHDLTDVLDPAVSSHLVTATATALAIRGLVKPAEIAELLWPSAPIIAAYDSIAQALHRDDASQPSALRRLQLAHALEREIRYDPLIPPEVRSVPWLPATLRTAWTERWLAISDDTKTRPYAEWLT